MTSLSMRGLVANPYELEIQPTRGTGRKTHALGAGIVQTNKWLAHPAGTLPLPAQGPAVEQLLDARTECLRPDLDDVADSAWAGLIARPQLAIPLAPTRILPDAALQRSFGLVTIYKRSEEHLAQAGLMHPRIAVTSRLTLEVAEDTGFIVAASLTSEWHSSSSALVAALEVLHGAAIPGAVSVRTHRRISVLVHRDVSERMTDGDRDRLARTAALLESATDIIDQARLDKRSIERRLAAAGGSALIVVGPVDSSTRDAGAIYLAAGNNRIVRSVLGDGPRDLVEALLEHIMELSGVSTSLLPIVAVDKSPKSKGIRAAIPISNPIDCLHHGDRFYLLDGDTGLWWTRDNDQHAGTIFKTYEEHDALLEHQADRDAQGTVINKHKGPSGMRIPRTDLHGCAKPPEKHLR